MTESLQEKSRFSEAGKDVGRRSSHREYRRLFFHIYIRKRAVWFGNMTENQNRILRLVMTGILLFSMFLTAGRAGSYVSSIRVQTYGDSVQKGSQNSGSSWGEEQDEKGVWKKNRKMAKYCVVVDAGHGGSDPGKVGINQALEKDVNLQIAQKLKAFLEAEDIRVVMTRETDGGLYDENVSNKKVQDMKRRIAIIEEADPVLVVSIHQNSYQQESVKGAQVFYYATSERSRMLASMIQKEFQVLQPDNRRLEKGNDSYYLLKKTAKPIVIAECGFLSNAEEAEKLVTQEYQERVAWRIHMGIMKYIGTGQTA